jgi:hypothetical protein
MYSKEKTKHWRRVVRGMILLTISLVMRWLLGLSTFMTDFWQTHSLDSVYQGIRIVCAALMLAGAFLSLTGVIRPNREEPAEQKNV